MPKYTTQLITIKPELKEWLRQYAKEHHMSMSKVINRQLRRLRKVDQAKKNVADYEEEMSSEIELTA